MCDVWFPRLTSPFAAFTHSHVSLGLKDQQGRGKIEKLKNFQAIFSFFSYSTFSACNEKTTQLIHEDCLAEHWTLPGGRIWLWLKVEVFRVKFLEKLKTFLKVFSTQTRRLCSLGSVLACLTSSWWNEKWWICSGVINGRNGNVTELWYEKWHVPHMDWASTSWWVVVWWWAVICTH